ncbi:MAG: tRNA (pseudouridine(54)-N(1))-methyltransferase TrmY [Gammaproteobacteria bacterium]|nr:tRNA (pseudouridine(54)-N(1))-methyltransferase TrmY [Gammaproteobacteria bacterium]MBT5602063.1 tRNA (pseudouridine(54)-N(1))-methyltransferase TrmY [Gammaproteobacteria bacterium]MBT6247378.1 tRNA (pseudouridine(54)-N(1))-methyltransferase TrmY [Gammaproteobacteria bacterium]
MPCFVVRCHSAPVEPERFLASIGSPGHVEFIAGIITNALFISQAHRRDTRLYLVFEDSRDFSRTLLIDGASIGDLGGLHERALLSACAVALERALKLDKGETVIAGNGIVVEAISFEWLVKRLATEHNCYLLHRKGVNATAGELRSDSVFILSDHVPMQKKSFNSMKRQGVKMVSLGPTLLFASQCITLLHQLAEASE